MVIAAVRYDRTPGGRTPANVAQLYKVQKIFFLFFNEKYFLFLV